LIGALLTIFVQSGIASRHLDYLLNDGIYTILKIKTHGVCHLRHTPQQPLGGYIMTTNKQVAQTTIAVQHGGDIDHITKWVHAVRMTDENDMGTTFTRIATWFNETWEVTIYEGNQYAADIISKTL